MRKIVVCGAHAPALALLLAAACGHGSGEDGRGLPSAGPDLMDPGNPGAAGSAGSEGTAEPGAVPVGGVSPGEGPPVIGGVDGPGAGMSPGEEVDVPEVPVTVPGVTGGDGFYKMERLNRGVVAVQVNGGNYVGWRMYGFEYDGVNPENVSYRLYRDGIQIADVDGSTNFLDAGGNAGSTYTVRPVIGGTEGPTSETAPVLPQQFLRVPLQVPAAGTTPATCPTPNEAYTYSANDGSPGDADGDGVYEVFLKWDPSNAKDNSQDGCTGNVFIDAYKVDGTRLWRIDLGPNIRGGAHYTQFVVYDFDGDGKAEMAVKTAPGTRDASGEFLHLGPAAADDDGVNYRNNTGRILTGPEYLTVFSGETGAELATVDFDQARGTVNSWGDNYGNRLDRFLASAAYLDDTGLPSFVMARGYYTRTTLSAWNWRDGQLTRLWKFDSNATPSDAAGRPFSGQGSHSMTIANADDDLGQEIMYGAMEIDNTGAGLCSTGYNHGDAEHVSDFIPGRPGLEFFMCNEDGDHPAYHLRDIRTCAIIAEAPINGADTGRCVAGDIDPSSAGAEMWASSTGGLFAAPTNARLSAAPGATNFLVWWDADESRELEDANRIDKFANGATRRLLTANGVASNNGSKSTPTLTADLYGDWREEVVWRE
ncbi:MAG TPA: rhamnogalacturonan lyase, partial [Polyangiaceae bacterium]|nr:rhamnogalacturonan lyase [Polyangiaceae bacterium]